VGFGCCGNLLDEQAAPGLDPSSVDDAREEQPFNIMRLYVFCGRSEAVTAFWRKIESQSYLKEIGFHMDIGSLAGF
jgi:hypothetical protein